MPVLRATARRMAAPASRTLRLCWFYEWETAFVNVAIFLLDDDVEVFRFVAGVGLDVNGQTHVHAVEGECHGAVGAFVIGEFHKIRGGSRP